MMMAELLLDRHNLSIFGDNAYHDPIEIQVLLLMHNVRIWAVPRKDSRAPLPREFKRLVSKLCLRIETAFSVLTTIFDFPRPSSRSLLSLITRMTSRLLAYTLCFITAPLIATGNLR